MKCPKCKNHQTEVLETKPMENGVRRRRHCLSPRCGQRFTTVELQREARQVADEATLRARALTYELKSKRVDQEALQAALATDMRRAAIARAARADRKAERDTWYDTGFEPAPVVLDRESLKRELGDY